MKDKNIGANRIPDNTLIKLVHKYSKNPSLAYNLEMMRRLKNSMKLSSIVLIILTIVLIILTIVLVLKS